jgi:hypothetical protein
MTAWSYASPGTAATNVSIWALTNRTSAFDWRSAMRFPQQKMMGSQAEREAVAFLARKSLSLCHLS